MSRSGLIVAGLEKGERKGIRNEALVGFVDVYQTNARPNRLTAILWVGTVVMLSCLCAAIPTKAQQEEQAVRISTWTGVLEITARNQMGDVRLISVKLNNQLLKEFKTHSGGHLDFLATYTGIEATTIVLRTNMGQGACVGTDVFVLTLYEGDELGQKKPHVKVSPILQKCMGEAPTVKFDMDDHGNEIIFVDGYELRNNRWIQERKRRRR